MKIAVEGCAHGELEKIYECLAVIQEREGITIDLLICCGDFQAVRNRDDLCCMAVPEKYQEMCTFYKYYSGEKQVPVLTLFIGGNHEASNYLQELPYGGWVAPNIYYMGRAGVVNFAGIRIGGLSGIFKSRDYSQGVYECPPYTRDSMRTIYHIRNLEVFRLRQIKEKIDIMLSHDWPKSIASYGNARRLLNQKVFLREEIESDTLGSMPGKELLHLLKPDYWFAAHMHVMFPAIVPHETENGTVKETKFLALDKCLPKRRHLQILDIPGNEEKYLKYDAEWLAILKSTNHLLVVKNVTVYMPGPGGSDRYDFTPTEEEKAAITNIIGDMTINPNNFVRTAPVHSPNSIKGVRTGPLENAQTVKLCELLGIDDPIQVLLSRWGQVLRKPSEPVQIKALDPPTPGRNSKLSLPAPTTSVDENESVENSNLCFSSSDINSSFIIDTSGDYECVTPDKKTFKRRNQAIYTPECDNFVQPESKSPKIP